MLQIIWHGVRMEWATPIDCLPAPTILQVSAHAHNWPRIGKGRQQLHDRAAAVARCCNSQMWMQHTRYML